ncbi:MAG: tetratricopeptide repeat protein [Armatimonas sp.]
MSASDTLPLTQGTRRSLHIMKTLRVALALLPMLALPGLTPAFAQGDNGLEIGKRADTLREAKDWAGAEKAYTQFIALNPTHASARLNRGMCRIKLGHDADAITDITSGLVLNAISVNSTRDAAISFTNRAFVWNHTGEPLRALVDCLNATRIDPNYAAAWSVLGDAWYKLGNLEQANICADKAHALDAGFTSAYTATGAASNAAGHRAVDDKADTKARFEEAFAAAEKGENDKALALYSEIIEIHPLDSAAWGNRAILHFDANRIDAALSDYSTAITAGSINKNKEAQANNLANRSRLYSRTSRYAEAVADLQLASPGESDQHAGSRNAEDSAGKTRFPTLGVTAAIRAREDSDNPSKRVQRQAIRQKRCPARCPDTARQAKH